MDVDLRPFLLGMCFMSINLYSWVWVYRRLQSSEAPNWGLITVLLPVKLILLGGFVLAVPAWLGYDFIGFGLGIAAVVFLSILGGIMFQNFIKKR